MYKQPENNNRVKYMKNKFEKLDLEKNNVTDLKITKVNNKSNDKNINNNNDYKNKLNRSDDKNNENYEKINPQLTRQLSDPSKKGCIKRTPAFRKEKFLNKQKSELSFDARVSIFNNEDSNLNNCDSLDNLTSNFLETYKERKKLKSSVSLVLNKPPSVLTTKRASLSPKKTISNPNRSSLYNLKSPKQSPKGSKNSLNRLSSGSLNSSGSDFGSPTRNDSSFLYLMERNKNDRDSESYRKSFGELSELNGALSGLNGVPLGPNEIQSPSSFKKAPLGSTEFTGSYGESRGSNGPNEVLTGSNKVPTSPTAVKISTGKKSSPKLTRSPLVSPKLKVKIREKVSDARNTFAATRRTSNSLLKEMIENETNSNFEKKSEIKGVEYAQVDKSKKKKEKMLPENLTDTLKAALKQPLPSGPPPKKPPRTFTHVVKSEDKIIETAEIKKLDNIHSVDDFLKKGDSPKTSDNTSKKVDDTPKKSKNDPKLMLQKLENALLSNKIKSPKLPKKIQTSFENSKLNVSLSPILNRIEPNLYTPPNVSRNNINKSSNCLMSLNCVGARESYSQCPTLDSKSTFFVDKCEEPIYAEPFEYRVVEEEKNDEPFSRLSTISRSVHYMSSPVSNVDVSPVKIDEDIFDNNLQVSKQKLDKNKFNLIMNHTYASLTRSDSDELDSTSSTPTSESPPANIRRNAIRDLIETYEKQLKNTEIHIKPNENHKKYPLLKQHSADNISARTNRDFQKQYSVDDNDKTKDTDYYTEERKKVKAELSRNLTEIRKNYVKRVCSSVRRKKQKEIDESPHLFECCLLVELNTLTLTPFVKGKYPINYKVPPWVEHLCYPDASDWSPEIISNPSTNQNALCQCYSLVITNEKGERKFGYCRRVLPEEASVCLPLTYCIISTFRAPGFYHKVLKELESRHGLPYWLQNAFLRELYNSKFPGLGQSVKIECLLQVLIDKSANRSDVENKKQYFNNAIVNGKSDKSKSERFKSENWESFQRNSFEDYDHEIEKNINQILVKLRENSEKNQIETYVKELREKSLQVYNRAPRKSLTLPPKSKLEPPPDEKIDLDNCMLSLNLPNSQLTHDCLLGDIEFHRPTDHRIEETDLTVLFETLNINLLLQLFGSLLLERKVVLISKCLSKLSSCVEAMQSILYPFSWQHTFIPVLSSNMLDILSAPLPLVAGVLANHLKEELILEDGIAMNLDTLSVLCSVGDESAILPKRLRNALSISLQCVTSSNSVDGSRNVLVSEAFMRMFVEVCGQYKQFIIQNDKHEKVFDRENFIKNQNSKSIQNFLEWFTETAMFHSFINGHIEATAWDGIFEQRCLELQNEKHKHRGMNMKKMKSFFKS